MSTDDACPQSHAGPFRYAAPPAADGFQIGPDRDPDVRENRPYFLVPLLAGPRNSDRRTRIGDWVAAEHRKTPFTDVFVLSHGWHRNLFSGVAAYDRLVGRFGRLFYTGRLRAPGGAPSSTTTNATAGFRPLFLNMHWHSDPGQDGWVDKAGRRDKVSFLRNIEMVFERQARPGCTVATSFTQDFEALFELLSEMSAPGIDALSDQDIQKMSPALTRRLDCYSVKDDGKATLSDKIVLAWTCYYEATPTGFLTDQERPPARHVGFPSSIVTLLSFLLGIVGLGTVIAGLLHPLLDYKHLVKPLTDWRVVLNLAVFFVMMAFYAAAGLFWGGPLHARGDAGAGGALDARGRLPTAKAGRLALLLLCPLVFNTVLWIVVPPASGPDVTLPHAVWPRLEPALRVLKQINTTLWLTLALECLLWCRWRWDPADPRGRGGKIRSTVSLPVLAWALAQVLLSVPLFLYAFVTYVVGRPLWPLFRERGDGPPPFSLRTLLAEAARLPIYLLQDRLDPENRVAGIVDMIHTQLAFFEMQRRGVQAGAQAARFLEDLFRKCPDLEDAGKTRLHFIGHSFGALVVANAARDYLGGPERKMPRRARTLCFLEGALASGWYDREDAWRDRVQTIAAVYSQYDTANGFLYPFASSGRMAAGAVGLTPDGADFQPEFKGRYAMLVRTPDLKLASDRPQVINLDASRLIYEGAVAVGGGHDDIFKDDVIYLLWALTGLEQPVASSACARPVAAK